MPHAPIFVPEVGGKRQANAQKTTQACENLASIAFSFNPDLIIIFSPHTPILEKDKITLRSADRHHVQFQDFQCEKVNEYLPNFLYENSLIRNKIIKKKHIAELYEEKLDHGASVPLYFLIKAGLKEPTLILSPNYFSLKESLSFSKDLKNLFSETRLKIAVVASADLSHSLRVDSPAGYYPQGKTFDETFKDIIKNKSYKDLLNINAKILSMAHQDAHMTACMAMEMHNFESTGSQFLTYEAPYGVGYLCALLYLASNK